MKKLICFAFLFLIVFGVYAQHINNYKYVIVPKKFSILKDTNQHQLNVLTRLLFKESGFTAIYDDELPDDLQRNNCLGLNADLENASGMFTTKLKVTLQDCKNNIIFTSIEGKSRKKDYKQAYQEALRSTFKSIATLQYTYESVAGKQPEKTIEKPQSTANTKVLYAQVITNGFQLVDSTPKIAYIIQNTNLQDVYILKDKNGILYKKDNSWIIEYYREGNLVREIVIVKF